MKDERKYLKSIEYEFCKPWSLNMLSMLISFTFFIDTQIGNDVNCEYPYLKRNKNPVSDHSGSALLILQLNSLTLSLMEKMSISFCN